MTDFEPAVGPDGTYSRSFLLWEARQAIRAHELNVRDAAHALRRSVGAHHVPTLTASVVGIAQVRKDRDPKVAQAWQEWEDATQALMDAVSTLIDIDPDFDATPYLAGRR